MGEPRARWASARWASQHAFSRGSRKHAPEGRATARRGNHSFAQHTCRRRALQLEHVCRSYERPHKPGGLMRGGGDSTHSVPCRFPGVLSRKHACWMSGSPEARVAPEASGIGESGRSRLDRSTRPRPIHCHGRFARSPRSSSRSVPRHGLVSSLVHRRHHRHGVSRPRITKRKSQRNPAAKQRNA